MMRKSFFILVSFFCWFWVEGQPERALLIDTVLYVGEVRAELAGTYLKSYATQNKRPVFVTDIYAIVKSPFYDYPFVWDVRDSMVYSISCANTRSPEVSRFWFFREKLAQEEKQYRRFRDSIASIELAKKIPDRKERMEIINDRLEKQSRFRNRRPILPLVYLFRWLSGQQGLDFNKPLKIGNVSFDMVAESDISFMLYIRDDCRFTIWQYNYPPQGEPDSDKNWNELITFSRDTIGSYHLPERSFWYHAPKLEYHPSGKNHQYQSIQDSAFFEGHFKIIRQKNETFCVNTSTGYIYHIGEGSIVKVGTVEVGNYPQWLLGKPLFIEDRDSQQLIFFADVKQLDNKLPFPDIVVLKTRQEVNKRFPGLEKL